MNPEKHDIEQLRKAWLQMGQALGMQPTPDSNPEVLDRKKTALDRLRNKYLVFWVMALCMAFGSFMIFSRSQIAGCHPDIWLGTAYAVYFLTVACMDNWLWRGIGRMDPLRMSVAEVESKSMFYRKKHLQFMVLIIPMAAGLLGFTAYVFSSEFYFLLGMAAGVVCGAIMAVIQFRRFMAEYGKLAE